MLTELTDDLLDLTARDVGRSGPRLAFTLSLCSCTCCHCVAFC